MPRHSTNAHFISTSPMAWSAGVRVLAVLPVVALLWLGVWWASLQVAL